jgi:hypothetical protein
MFIYSLPFVSVARRRISSAVFGIEQRPPHTSIVRGGRVTLAAVLLSCQALKAR